MAGRELNQPAAPRRTLGRRVARAVAIVLGVLLGLVAITAAVLLHDLDARVRSLLVARAAELSERIGRPVSVGPVEASLGLVSQVLVRDVVVGAAPGAVGPLARPPLRIASARVGVDLGLLARTRGREVVVTRVEVEGAEVALARTPEGLSIDDVRAKLAVPPPTPPPTPPAAPTPPPSIRLERLAVTGAKLRYDDLVTGADVTIDAVALEGEGLRPDAPSRVSLRAAVGAAEPNVRATLDLAPPAPGKDPAPTHVEAHAEGVRVAPLLAAMRVAPRGVALGDATISIDATVEPGAIVRAKVGARLAGARLAEGDAGTSDVGEPIDASVALEGVVDRDKGTVEARGIEAKIGAIGAHGAIALRGAGEAASIDRLELAVDGDAAGLVALLPPSRRPRGVALAGPIAIAVTGSGDRGAARGHVKASVGGVRLEAPHADGVEAGAPVAVGLEGDVAFAAETKEIRATGLALDVGGLVTKGELVVDAFPPSPRLASLGLDVAGPIDAALAALPPSRRPHGVALRGALAAAVHARADGDAWAGAASIDLSRASLGARGLAKPIGAPLAIEVEGKAREAGVDVSRARLHLGPLSLTARGHVAGPERLDLAFDGEVGSIAGLVALAPAVAERLAGKVQLDGRARLDGTLRRAGAKVDVAAKASLRALELRRGLASLRGDAVVDVRASAAGNDASATIALDLGAAALDVALVGKKPAGAPARVSLTAERSGDAVKVRDARLELPGLSLAGIEVSAEPHALRVRCAPESTISVAKLVEGASPLVRSRVPAWAEASTLRFALELVGDPEDLAAASLTLPSFELVTASAHVRGSAAVDAVGKPRKVRFELTGGELTLPERHGDGAGDGAPELPGDVHVDGRVRLDALRVGGVALTGVDVEAALDEGRLRVASLRAGAFGGTVTLAPTTLELGDVPELDVHARLDGVDLGALPHGSLKALAGRLSGSIDVRARGATRDALAASAKGELALAARGLHVEGLWEPKWRFANRFLAALAERRKKAEPPGPRLHVLDAKEASLALALDRGKVVTRSPFVLRTDDLEARLEGHVATDAGISLDGVVLFSPRAVEARSGGALVPKEPVPLKLHVGGRAGAPEIELVELADTLRALRGAGAAPGADAPF